MRIADFKVMTFDCYGTLIDWETGMFEALQPLVSSVRRPLSRNQVLEAHGRHESAQQLVTPTRLYKELLAVVYKRLAEEWGVPASWDECIAYGLSVRNWPPFPDSAEALQYLKKHYKLVILSNVDNEFVLLLEQEAASTIRRDFHGRGHRIIQAFIPQLRVHARKAGGLWDQEGGNSTYRGEPVPRSRTCQRRRAGVMLDPSPP